MQFARQRIIKSGRADKDCERAMGMYLEAEPATGKVEGQSFSKKNNACSATMILLKHRDDWDDKPERQPTINIQRDFKAVTERL